MFYCFMCRYVPREIPLIPAVNLSDALNAYYHNRI